MELRKVLILLVARSEYSVTDEGLRKAESLLNRLEFVVNNDSSYHNGGHEGNCSIVPPSCCRCWLDGLHKEAEFTIRYLNV